uniref:Lipocalin/cytosolic fatty-acid binding domain-containing protein n=1 Tax=Chrysemys picta bellii TaxID=8478 RepID=A0A8C3I2N4_CHRPI
MTAMLLSLTLALLGVFQARAEVPVQPDFDAAKFSGMWHIMVAVSNCPIFQSMKDLMKTSAAMITVTPEDNLHFKIGYPFPDGCKKIELVFEKTGQLGHYTNSRTSWVAGALHTDYTHYAIVYTFKDSDGKSSTTLQLYSRCWEKGTWPTHCRRKQH